MNNRKTVKERVKMSWIEWSDRSFRGLDLTKLKVDEAYLNVSNANNVKYFLYSLSEECVKCPFRKIKNISSEKDTILKINTAREFELRLFQKDHGDFVNPDVVTDGLLWSGQPTMGEFGVYDLIVTKSSYPAIQVAKYPVSTFSCESLNLFCIRRRQITNFLCIQLQQFS